LCTRSARLELWRAQEVSMARKKNPGPVPPGSKHVRLELSEEQRADLREIAGQADMSMAALSRAAIVKMIDDWKKKGKRL
jgi:hypothetical protein